MSVSSIRIVTGIKMEESSISENVIGRDNISPYEGDQSTYGLSFRTIYGL